MNCHDDPARWVLALLRSHCTHPEPQRHGSVTTWCVPWPQCAPAHDNGCGTGRRKLTADSHVAPVIDHLLRRGADLLTVRQGCRALRAFEKLG